MGVSVAELEDYINNLEPVGFFHSIPQFPISKSSVLQFPTSTFDADARNALRGDKREYIPEYLPPLAPLHQGTSYRMGCALNVSRERISAGQTDRIFPTSHKIKK